MAGGDIDLNGLMKLSGQNLSNNNSVSSSGKENNINSIFMKKLDADSSGTISSEEIKNFLSGDKSAISDFSRELGLTSENDAIITKFLHNLANNGNNNEITNAKLVDLGNNNKGIIVSYQKNKAGNFVTETYDLQTGSIVEHSVSDKKHTRVTSFYRGTDNVRSQIQSSNSKEILDRYSRLIRRETSEGEEEYTYEGDRVIPSKVRQRYYNGTSILRENGKATITHQNGRTEISDDSITTDKNKITENEESLLIDETKTPKSKNDGSITQQAKQIANKLQNIICGSGPGRLKKLKNLLNNYINSQNIDWVLYEYRKLTKRTLSDDLKIYLKNNPTEYKNINRQLAKIQYEKYGVDLNFKNYNSVVSNKYRQGLPYSIVQDGTLITITNENTGKQKVLDLDKLLKNYPNNYERAKVIKMLQKMPGEVLMDVAFETDSLIPTKNEVVEVADGGRSQAAGYYNGADDTIHIDPDKGALTLVHEMGHSVDYNKVNGKNNSSVMNDPHFKKLFNEEMRNYLAAGNKRYKYDPSGVSNCPRYTYATANEREMFAECYTLLMMGKCGSQQVITKYFPKTLEYINRKIEQNRSQKDSIRH